MYKREEALDHLAKNGEKSTQIMWDIMTIEERIRFMKLGGKGPFNSDKCDEIRPPEPTKPIKKPKEAPTNKN